MTLLLIYWGMILAGYFIGSKCRVRKEKFSWIGTLLSVAIILILSTMGVRMGANKEVMENFHIIGRDAFIMTVVIMAGSIIAVMAARKLLGIDRYGEMKGGRAKHDPEIGCSDILQDLSSEETADSKGKSSQRMTILILLSVALGTIFGYLFVHKLFPDYSRFEAITGDAMIIGIGFLLFLLGMNLGLAGTIVNNLKKAGFLVLVFPVAVIIGTLIAAFLCSLILSMPAKEALAIGAGFGWSGFAPVIITGQGYAVAGAIAFMHSMMRQLGGIVLIPVVAHKIGYIEATSLPGIAAMDIGLPLVESSCGERIVIYSFSMGLVQTAAVTILVPLIISL